MTFDEILSQVLELLQREGRVSYRALKRRFGLDDDYLEDLKDELIKAKQLARDEEGAVLVWIGASPVSDSTFQVSGSQPLAPSPSPSDARRQTLDPRPTAGERRQLTVQFIDLVGSTALSEQLDPEELHAVIHAYQEVCTGTISRFEGHIAQYLGDGLLVYFGYPVAHEDDAARAVRAGLEMIDAIHQLNTRLSRPIQVRIGIHTGPVVVGEIGSGEKRELLALGETPNLAARVQTKAAPDTVLISAATSRLVQGLFDCQSLGEQTLKGLTTPLALYQVQGASEDQSHFEAATRRGLTPLVGRDHEASLLMDRWTQVKEGQGQVVLVSGEAGIGKSRLVQLLKERVASEAQVQVECRCSPYYQNSALYPVITHLQKFLQFDREEAAPSKLQKLERMLSAYQLPLSEAVPLLAVLLSFPHPDKYPELTFSPQKQKQRTLETLLAWLLKEAERQPVRVVWEDLHWADPTTLEFVRLLIEQAPTTRMLVLATFRPEFQPLWSGRSHITQLTLNRLSPRQVEAMVEKVTGGKTLPAEVVRQILLKTDGVPLFVEELTKMVLESGLLRATDEQYELTGPLPPLAIPSTLQDSLMARLDRLSSVREVAQLGAILGREFSYELLHAVSPLDERTLQNGLIQLVEAELLYQRGMPPHATYLFKHALIQDTAYQSLLKSKRQQLHQQVARILAEQFADLKETQPELLAHHYTEAGLTEQAIPYWQQAGQRAASRSANSEASNHLTKGIELLKTLPDAPERTQQELDLQITLGPALIAIKGWSAPEVERSYTRARKLCQQVGETPQIFPVLFALSVFYFTRAEYTTARELGEQLLRLAQCARDPALFLEAHRALAMSSLWPGELVSAREHCEQGITFYDPQQHGSHTFLYGSNPKVVCSYYASFALWFLGYPDQALNRCYDALTLAHDLSHPFSLASALNASAILHKLRGEVKLTQERAKATIALCTEQGIVFWLAMGTILQGWALAGQEQEEGIAQIRQGMAAFRATGAEALRPWFLTMLAEAYGKVGQVEEGLTVLAEALAFMDKTGERVSEAELYRLKGELTLVQSSVQSLESRVKEAEECFRKAIEIARKQQAKSLELRAVMSLSRLWQRQGRKDEARQMLAEIYNWFTEGFDTKDLQEAKALLEELSQ
jgi:class 3 adenylate cyclase/predicted ATPase